MKCPNCSFNNPDSAEICKVCGYELQSTTQADTKEEEIDLEADARLRSLFDGDSTASEEEDLYEMDAPQEPKRKFPIWVLLLLALLVLIVFLAGRLLGPDTSDDATEPTSKVPIVVPTDRTAPDQVDQFFALLPSFVNQDNIAILNVFTNSEASLTPLKNFSKSGSLDSIDAYELSPIHEAHDVSAYKVLTEMTRTNSEGTYTETYEWQFEITQADGKWLISEFEVSNFEEPDQVPSETEPTTAPEPTSEPETTTSETAPTTEAATEPVRPEGFITTGNFTGGTLSDGQDIYAVRYGHHDTFDRLVFDLYAWTGAEPTETVSEIGRYEATVTSDGKLLTILISGARGAFASRSTVAFPNVEAIEYFYPNDDSAVGIRILLTDSGAFKVFELKAPGRLIVDYYIED